MRRRTFITLLGGAVAWPVVTRAQQGERVRLIGILNILGKDDPEAQARLKLFYEALGQLGWQSGRDFKIESRQVGGDVDRLRRYATELAALGPDVILSIGSISVGALQQATRTIPIVFVNVPDPVGAGFVQNMAHPGGNTTGFSNFEYSMSGKWAELLKQTAPRITRALVLRDPSSAAGIGQFASVRSVAQSLGVELTPLDVRDTGEIERGFAAFASAGDGGVIVYGPNTHEPVRRAAGYVDRILKGEKPGNMPVQAPTKYDLIINLKTAKALGISIPQSLLATADEVIE